ncbi:zinc finger Y-chromosomal protein 1-like [Aphomia sociella]
MEFDDIVVKESPGLCRCCLSEGCYKDLGKEYTWMNENEVYADMLLECFDISISQHNEGPNGPNRLICEVCITRLRDACNFKKQVLDSEKKFVDMIGRGEFRPKVLIYQAQMKAESDEVVDDDAEVEYLEDDIEFGDDEPLKAIENPEPSVSEDITVTTLPVKNKRGRPKKNATLVKPEKKAKTKLEEKARTSKALVKEDPETPMKNKQYEKQKKLEFASLLKVIIENSTIMPFRWYKGKFMCFYCCELFDLSSELKEHSTNHPEVDMAELLLRCIYKNYKIKLDFSEAWCTVCPVEVQSFEDYLNHISECHDLVFDETAKELFDEFKLSDDSVNCPECEETFRNFAMLQYHIHKAHPIIEKRKFLCEICGKDFSKFANVDIHIKQTHCVQKCKDCNKTFPSRYALETHVENVHKTDVLKCPLCPKVLGTRYLKRRHLALVHDYKSVQVSCDLCSMIFTRNHKLQLHKRRVHYKEKNMTCELCGYVAFNMESLKRHMVSHDDARPFQCNICQKTFQRKLTLKTHMKTHSF